MACELKNCQKNGFWIKFKGEIEKHTFEKFQSFAHSDHVHFKLNQLKLVI